jgi:thermitase
MKPIILGAVLVLALSACTTEKKVSSRPAKPVKKSEVIPNQFVFGGEKTEVETYLSSQGIKFKIETLSAEDKHYLVRYQGKQDLQKLVDDVNARVEFAEPNFKVEQLGVLRKAEWPTDKFFFKQWALNNIGQAAPYGLPGVKDADMDILRVWSKVTTGSADVIVAVVDTGCDYTHPDLKDNIWVNEKESPAKGGIAGKDDDGNGYIDDVYGYDFTSTGRMEFDGAMPGDADPMDESSGHGTHCAGSIGAKANDGMGTAGLNWNVKIMCVRFLGEGGGSTVDAYRAVRYARINGAHILSNSWGGTGSESQLFKSELRKLQDKGILFVAAAGNAAKNNDVNDYYPTNLRGEEYRGKKFDNVLSVAASDNQDAPADFTNYGHEKVDVFAPGVAILSTYPQALLEDKTRPPYATMSGTSMATPFVAGVAALMMAANPSLKGNAAEVIRIINATADVKENLIGKVVSNGRINAYKAVTYQTGAKDKTPVWQTKSEKIDQRGFNKELVDIRHEIKVEGAKAVKVHFDFLQVEEPFDSVYLYDKDYRLIARIEQNMVDDFWSPAIPGDRVYVRFVNSLLQQIKMAPMELPSESTCISRGATSVEKVGTNYKCMVDSELGASSGEGGGSDKYTSFNSEGFSIDQVSFVTEDLADSPDSRKE